MKLDLGFDPNDPEMQARLAIFAQDVVDLALKGNLGPLPAVFGMGVALTGIANILHKHGDLPSSETEIKAALLAVLKDAVAGCTTSAVIL